MNFNGDVSPFSEGQHHQSLNELYETIEREENVFGKRVFAGITNLTSRPTLATILRTCGIRSPRWYALFKSKGRKMPVEPDLIARLAVLLHDDPVDLYAQALHFLSPAEDGFVLKPEYVDMDGPTETEREDFFRVRDARAAATYGRVEKSHNEFALTVFHRLMKLYHTRSRRTYTMRGLAMAASTHVAKIHTFLEETGELFPWDLCAILRMALFLEVDPLDLLARFLEARSGELTVSLLGTFSVHTLSQGNLADAFLDFQHLWNTLIAQIFTGGGIGQAMEMVEQFMAWRFLSWERIRQVRKSLTIFEGKVAEVKEVREEQPWTMNAEEMAQLTACWTLLWETLIDISMPNREEMVKKFLEYWRVYSALDQVEKLVLASQMRLSDEASQLLPEVAEKERSKLFPALKERHTKKGQE